MLGIIKIMLDIFLVFGFYLMYCGFPMVALFSSIYTMGTADHSFIRAHIPDRKSTSVCGSG